MTAMSWGDVSAEIDRLTTENQALRAQPCTVDRLRRLAAELEWANDLYGYNHLFGMWNPKNARYEADYLEANP